MTRHQENPVAKARARFATAASLAGLLVLIGCCAWHSAAWIGRTFPGFLLLPNHVIASAGLSHWTGTTDGRLFQHVVERVDGRPVSSSEEVYALVGDLAPGTPVRYALRRGERSLVVEIPTIRFTVLDFVLLFGAYLFNGIVFALVGLFVWHHHPRGRAERGLLALCLTAGCFAIAGTDLYGPYWFYRLHFAAEALLPAAVLHIALVFPREKAFASDHRVVTAIYGVFALVALIYQASVFAPVAYSTVHDAITAATGIAGGLFLAGVFYDSVWTRPRTVHALAATAAGLLLPTLIFAASGMTGGTVSLSTVAFSAFLLPLGIGFILRLSPSLLLPADSEGRRWPPPPTGHPCQ